MADMIDAFTAGEVDRACRINADTARVLRLRVDRAVPQPAAGQGRLPGPGPAPSGQCRPPMGAAPPELDGEARLLLSRLGAPAAQVAGLAEARSGGGAGPSGKRAGETKKKAAPATKAAADSRQRDRRRSGPARGGPAPVRIVFLGGLGEIGRNCACVEVDGRIIVLDCGIMFPDPDMPGVDLVLPDFSYLHENAERVDAVVLTHGHEDHTGGPGLLAARPRAPHLRLGALPRPGPQPDRRGRADRPGPASSRSPTASGVRVGPCDVEFIPVTHSVPNAFAIAFHTPQGVILHSGDFKLDLQPVDGRRTDLARIGALASDRGDPAAAVRLDQRRGAGVHAVGAHGRAHHAPGVRGPGRAAGWSWPASPATSTGSSRSSTPPWPAAARWPPSGARWARTWSWPAGWASSPCPRGRWSTSTRSTCSPTGRSA